MSSVGQILGGVVGGIVGFFAGGNVMLGAQIGMTLGGLLNPPKGPTVEGPRIADLSFQTSTYGAAIPRVYATSIVAGNVFWLENNQLKEVRTKKKSGGKGGPKTTTKTYAYYATFAVGLCEGEIAGVLRIWIGTNLIYNAGSTDAGTIQASNAAAEGFRVYTGSETQSADPRMQATLGVDNTPAYRGLAYIVFDDLPLEKYGNSLQGAQVRVEVMQLGATYDYVATRHDMPTSLQWQVAASNGSLFVRLAFYNTSAWTSPDGITWTEQSGKFTGSPNWQGIVYGNGLFVATTYQTGFPVWRSADGITWYSATTPSGSGTQEVAFGNGIFVIVTDGGHVYRSADAVTWTKHDLPYSNTYAHILFNGSVFLVWQMFANKVMVSADGINWTGGTPAGAAFNQHGWGAVKRGEFMLFSSVSAAAKRSADGLTWVDVAVPPYTSGYAADDWNWICFSNSGFAVSPDGVSWTSYAGSLTSSGPYKAAAWSGAVIAVANQLSAAAYTIQPTFSAATNTTLSAVVSAECQRSGILTAGDLDVSGLTQSVAGYRIGSRATIRSAVEPLQAAWPFDVVQRGYKIHFIPRGGSAVATIATDDLGAHADGEAQPVRITTSREMDTQLPRKIALQFLDRDRDQERGEQYAERLNTTATNILARELPISLNATEAAGMAEVLLYLAWLERFAIEFSLPANYNHLEPADVVNLPTTEGTVSVRLTAIEYTSDGRLDCQARYNQPAIYTPTAVGAAGVSVPTQTIVPIGPAVYHLLDIPQVHDVQNAPGILAAMSGTADNWPGGALMQSTDAGATWADIQDFDAPGATIGYATTTIGAVEPRLLDASSRLTVTLTSGDLYSCTEAAMLAGANHFAYGADGRWEICAARICTLQSGKTYVLSDFWRGRFGTEWAMSLHQAGDAIILLDTDDLAPITLSASLIGLARHYRGITYGRDISTDSNRAFTYQAINLKPLSPILLNGHRDASGNWSLSWVRRARGLVEWRDYVDTPLNEATEQYQIEIFQDGGYTTVKRTLAVSAASASYTTAEQTADFGANQPTLYLRIYQLSATVGRGYPLQQSITR
jgi:hypothetical protein